MSRKTRCVGTRHRGAKYVGARRRFPDAGKLDNGEHHDGGCGRAKQRVVGRPLQKLLVFCPSEKPPCCSIRRHWLALRIEADLRYASTAKRAG